MGAFDELESMIMAHTQYNYETRENEKQYLALKEEINMHTNGELKFDQLSPDAQKVMKDWESFISDMNAFDSGDVGWGGND